MPAICWYWWVRLRRSSHMRRRHIFKVLELCSNQTSEPSDDVHRCWSHWRWMRSRLRRRPTRRSPSSGALIKLQTPSRCGRMPLAHRRHAAHTYVCYLIHGDLPSCGIVCTIGMSLDDSCNQRGAIVGQRAYTCVKPGPRAILSSLQAYKELVYGEGYDADITGKKPKAATKRKAAELGDDAKELLEEARNLSGHVTCTTTRGCLHAMSSNWMHGRESKSAICACSQWQQLLLDAA